VHHARASLAVLLAAIIAAMAYIPAATASARPALLGSTTGHTAGLTGLVTAGAQTLSFEPNRGQAAPGATFLGRGAGYFVALAATGAALTLGEGTTPASLVSPRGPRPVVLRLTLLGGSPAARGQGQQTLPGTVGYAGGQGVRPALNDIPTYAAVRYAAVYPGVDVLYYGHAQHLEYDFRVAPGADPSRIRLRVAGVEQLSLAADGDLLLRTAAGMVRQHRPLIYQLVHGARRLIGGGYLLAGHTLGFHLGTYDRRAALVIDPELVYSTYVGNKSDDDGNGIAVDGRGNVYIAGTTMNAGVKVAFVAKLGAAGKHVVYTKFVSNIYNNEQKACDSTATGIAVDGQGNAYVTGTYGYTDQFDLCTNEAVLWAKVDRTGAFDVKIFGKYGGSKGNAIAIDGHGNTYLTGATDQWEANFPVTPGAFQPKPGIDKEEEGVAGDAFVLKIDPSGTVLYGTFLGGSGIDEGLDIAVDAQGEAYVVGTSGIYLITGALDFPITTNAFQRRPGNPYAAGFLSVLSADGSALLYSTYLSGDNGESITGVALDAQGNAYVTGSTDSRTFPTTPNAYKRTCGTDGMCNPQKVWYHDYGTDTNYWHIGATEDVFVARIDPRRSGAASLLYSTFVGGMNRDLGTAIAVDAGGRAYVTGRTASSTYPGAATSTGSHFNVLLTVIDPARAGQGSLVFSATFGGNGDGAGNAIALDAEGNVYLTGYTNARDFPTRAALQPALSGGYDAFVTKIGGFGA
jgi:hypothetical protein